MPNHVVLAIEERPSLSAELCQKPSCRQTQESHQPKPCCQPTRGGSFSVSQWVQPSNGRPTTSVVRPCVFIVLSCVLCQRSGTTLPARTCVGNRVGVKGAGSTVRLLWQIRTRRQPSAFSVRWAVSDTDSASTRRFFRSVGCVTCSGGVKSLPVGAARRFLWFLFFHSFPFLFCHAASRGQY